MKQYDEEKSFGLLIKDLSNLVRRLFDSKIKDVVPVSTAQWHVLIRLWQKDGVSQSDLAERVEIEQSSLVRHLDHLEAEGFINRKPDENDRRSNRIYLTPASTPLFEKVFAVVGPLREELISDLTPAEYEQMMSALRRLKSKTVSLLEKIEAGAAHEKV